MSKIKSSILFIISIFCVAVVCVIFYNLYTDSKAKVVNKGSKQDSGNGIIAMEIPNPGHRKDFIYPSDNIRDPFQVRQRTVITPQQKLSVHTDKLALKLTGVIWKDGKAIAIIKDSNNQTYLAKAGEKIDNFRVIDIKPRMVKVQRDNEVIPLTLWPEAKM